MVRNDWFLRGVCMAAAGLLVSCTTAITLPIDVATTVAEERKLSDVGDDVSIKAAILKGFAEEAKGLLVDVNTDVYQGRVMLTGSVKKVEDRRKAADLTRKVEGVREVYDEIQVTEEGGIGATAKDIGIELKLKANLLVARGVSSINYRWRAVNGVVYFIGLAQDQEELDKVLTLAKELDGVRTVVSHVRIKPKA